MFDWQTGEEEWETSRSWQAIQRGARLRQDIQATVDVESWARESRNLRLYRSLLDPEADPGWRDRQVRAFRSSQDTTPPQMVLTVDEVLLWARPRHTFIANLVDSDAEVSLRGSPTWTERDVDPAISYLYDEAVAYFADTYGRHRLGSLVRRAESHAGWERLLPAVVGAPFADFEAGWQTYLAARYDDG